MQKQSGKILGALVMALVLCLGAIAQAISVQRLTINEAAALASATHRVIITHNDLTTSATGTAQAVTMFAAQAKQGVELVAMKLNVPFKGPNTNLVSVALTVGDGTADRYLQTTELCERGTEIYLKYGRDAQTVYTSATDIKATFTPTDTVVGLSDLNEGEVVLYFRVLDARSDVL